MKNQFFGRDEINFALLLGNMIKFIAYFDRHARLIFGRRLRHSPSHARFAGSRVWRWTCERGCSRPTDSRDVTSWVQRGG